MTVDQQAAEAEMRDAIRGRLLSLNGLHLVRTAIAAGVTPLGQYARITITQHDRSET
jgi:hypothetical protein